MDFIETQNCVKELDLTVQPRLQPRYKTWLPLATQQLHLRNLIQIIGFNLQTVDTGEVGWFYYTLHRSTMSSPLYTSEPIDNKSPKWSSLEVPTLHETGYATATEIIVRVWRRSVKNEPSTDVTMFTWGISFSGLMYLGPKLPTDLKSIFHDNTLIFFIHGGYFAPIFSFLAPPEAKKYLLMNINTSEVRDSYSVSKLSSLKSTMQALKQQTDSVKNLREKIALGESVCMPKYPRSSLNRLLQPKRANREKRLQISKVRKELEIAKFRTKLLEQERVRKMGEIRALNLDHSELLEKNEDYGCALMDKYRELSKEMESLNERRQGYIDSKELFLQTTTHLAHRRRQLISELSAIYPINIFSKNADEKYTINNVYLPDSEKLDSSNDTHVAVALGFVAHTTQMIAGFLNIPTRYPVIHYGSRSKIVDHININLPDNERQFPLFARSKDKLQFHYAVYLLNKNIAQLRWYCGLPTADLRATLSNLAGLINIRPNYNPDSPKRTTSNSSLDIDMRESRHNLFPNIPYQKTPSYHFQSSFNRSIGRFKNTKVMLGSSLDQGLNQPFPYFRQMSYNLKRISKSEENTMDNETLAHSTAVPEYSVSSDETFIENVFYKSMESNNQQLGPELSEDDEKDVGVNDTIEITVPMSVSKPKINLEKAYIRKRSSNSISSCEMALGGSLIDNEEMASSIDELATKSSNGTADLESKEILVNTSISDIDNRDTKMASESDANVDQAADSLSKIFLDETDCDLLLRSEFATSSTKPSEVDESSELTSSLEYIDSVRRSTENVFARTEALANKSCSFKVMRPRL